MNATNAVTCENEAITEARAAGEVYGALARMFASAPTERSYAEFVQVACLLGCDGFAPGGVDFATAEAVFDARFVVPGGRTYVPLSENCIALAGEGPAAAAENGTVPDPVSPVSVPRIAWGPLEGARSAHVAACYAAAGFDPDAVRMGSPEAATLRDDSLAVELAFMAYLAAGEAAAREAGNEAQTRNARNWQARFLRDHLLMWVGRAAVVLARTGDDLYAQAALLAESWCKFDTERLG